MFLLLTFISGAYSFEVKSVSDSFRVFFKFLLRNYAAT